MRLEKYAVVSEFTGQGLTEVMLLPFSVINWYYDRAMRYGTPAMRDARSQLLQTIDITKEIPKKNKKAKDTYLYAPWLKGLKYIYLPEDTKQTKKESLGMKRGMTLKEQREALKRKQDAR